MATNEPARTELRWALYIAGVVLAAYLFVSERFVSCERVAAMEQRMDLLDQYNKAAIDRMVKRLDLMDHKLDRILEQGR